MIYVQTFANTLIARELKMQYWFKQQRACVCVPACIWIGPYLFDACFPPMCCNWLFLWRKLVSPSALQSHLEFICKPDPDSCLFFPLLREEEEWRERGGQLLNEWESDRYQRGQMKNGSQTRRKTWAKVAEDCFHSRICGLSTVCLVEHLGHTGQ